MPPRGDPPRRPPEMEPGQGPAVEPRGADPTTPPRPDVVASPPGWPPPPATAVPARERPAGPGPWGMAVPWGFWESVLVGVVGFILGGVLAAPFVVNAPERELTGLPFAIAGIL